MISKILTRFSFVLMLVSSALYAADFPYSEWNLAMYEGAYASVNGGTVSVMNGGSDYWHVQLTRKNIELQNGKTYELKFFLQGVGNRKVTEVRIGRDGAPYDAFAEFGEVAAMVDGRFITKTFIMNSGNVNNARLEFNLGKNVGTIYFSDVSLTCLDCGSGAQIGSEQQSSMDVHEIMDYAVVADEVDFRPYSMALGDVFGLKLLLGADSKIYGNVNASNECTLNERAYMKGNLQYAYPCKEQNNVVAASKKQVSLTKPVVTLPGFSTGVEPVSVNLDESEILPPGNYGTFYANARSKVTLSSGSYTFQSFFTEPDAKFTFDMTSGPVSIAVAGNVRFGDRNKFVVINGNPSEITWSVAGDKIDMGTDGLYFGKFIAPSAFMRIPSRSHLVGTVYVHKFQIEPQSTISHEPRANEISHNEEHFGPFFESGIFRYTSQLPLSTSSIEMFVYADNMQVKVNGGSSTIVHLPSSNETVIVSIKQKQISGFPAEAFRCNYVFNFIKSVNYRIFWNPQTQCKQDCDGTSPATAVGDFVTALEMAKVSGREINMVGGIWDVTQNYADGVVPWNVGFELVGYTGNIWDLSSASSMPTIFLGESSHIQIYGKSPRSLTGFWIGNGYNKNRGGAIASESQHLKLKSMLLSAHKSDMDGGALFSADTLEMYNVHFKNCQSKENGGAVYVEGLLKMQNVIFNKNFALGNGGASYSSNKAFVQNAIFSQNESNGEGGAWFAQNGIIKISNATVFDNNGKQGFSAIGGNVTGQIYNSILWKNVKSFCSLENCKKEVSPSISISYSITETDYNGLGNVVENPKFLDEMNPAGNNEFMGMKSGLTLQDDSPAIKAGIKDDFVLESDILNIVRGEKIDLGAYAWYNLNADLELGEFTYGEFKLRTPSFPVFDRLGDERDIVAIGNSPKGRVMRKMVPLSQGKNIRKAVMEFTLLNEYGKPYANLKKQRVTFFKLGEVGDKCVFQTLVLAPSAKDYDPETHGRLILFTSDVNKIGKFGNVQVLPILGLSDNYYGETVDWE